MAPLKELKRLLSLLLWTSGSLGEPMLPPTRSRGARPHSAVLPGSGPVRYVSNFPRLWAQDQVYCYLASQTIQTSKPKTPAADASYPHPPPPHCLPQVNTVK